MNERGFAFPLVIVLLLLGGLIISPLLGYVSTGLRVGEQKEQMMGRLYTSDAGVEDALWYLITVNSTLDSLTFPINRIVTDVNDNSANVTIERVNDLVLKITSITTDNNGSTTVESYVEYVDFSGILDNIVTSPDEITWNGPYPDLTGSVNGTYTDDWPTSTQMSAYFLQFVDPIDDYYDSDVIDVKDIPIDASGNKVIGPLYRDGDLVILNTGTAGDALVLGGTIYITGKLEIATTNKDMDLYMNGQTIFVKDASVDPVNAMEIGGKCTLTHGSGCLIAVGDVYLQPRIDTSPGDFLLVMSIDGTVNFQPQPGSEFYGSIAGGDGVHFQPGGEYYWEEWYECDEDGSNCESSVNFPNGIIKIFEILSWQVSP